ncbi:MAG: DUF3237 domain-containing protein [Sphingomonas sp.]
MKSMIAGFAATLLSTGVAYAAEPVPPHLEYAFEELVTLSPGADIGQTPYGGRTMIPITGGTFEGPGLKGTIVPGGWDWQLRRADGCTNVKADYMLKTDDGVIINVVNTGAICPGAGGKMATVRTSPVFEAPLGKYQWLGQTAFIGTLEPATGPDGKPAVKIKFYKAM